MPETCPNCDTPVRANYRFCSSCGALLPCASDTVAPLSSANPAREQATFDSQPIASELRQSGSTPAFVVRHWDTLQDEVPTANGAQTEGANYGSPYAPPLLPAVLDQRRVGERTSAPSSRRAGAAYTPYVPDAVKHLQDPRSGRSWLMPVVVACVVVLLGMFGAGIYLNSVATHAANNVTGSPGDGNTSEEDATIRALIRSSNDNEIKSLRDLDTEVLKATSTGNMLRIQTQAVEELSAKNQYQVAVNTKLEILDVRVSGNTATAHTIETWEGTYYSKADNKVVGKDDPVNLDENYHFVKKAGKWFVDSVQASKIG